MKFYWEQLSPREREALLRHFLLRKPLDAPVTAEDVCAALEKNPYHGIFHKTVRRLGNIPPPAPGEPWQYALGELGALEEVYRRADFLNVSVRAVPIQRRLASAAAAVENMRKGAGDSRELMNRLNEADRERAWAEIAEQFRQYEGPNGLEIPGEVLIGVGTKQ